MEQPTLQTPRLLLRPFVASDAPHVQRLAGAYEIAATTLNVPHPYKDGMAEAWIASHPASFGAGRQATFAIVWRESGELCGAIGLGIQKAHQRAEMGYWVAHKFWGRGICTEAGRALVAYGFETLGLHRIGANHLKVNPASGRVMQKIGMSYEGCQREHALKWGTFHDLEYYGLLATDWRAQGGA